MVCTSISSPKIEEKTNEIAHQENPTINLVEKTEIQRVKKTMVSSFPEFSITSALNKKEENIIVDQVDEKLSENHFSQKDLDLEWNTFLQQISKENPLTFYAIRNFKLKKKEENVIEISYSSNSAKNEFNQIQGDFFSHFKHKVRNYKIELTYIKDGTLIEEILTQKKIFEKFAENNPLLKKLNDLMLFDLS